MSGLGEMGNLLKQAQEMQRQVDRVRNEMKSRVIEGHAGGGVVRVEVTANRHEVKRVHISPDVLKSDDPKLIALLKKKGLWEQITETKVSVTKLRAAAEDDEEVAAAIKWLKSRKLNKRRG